MDLTYLNIQYKLVKLGIWGIVGDKKILGKLFSYAMENMANLFYYKNIKSKNDSFTVVLLFGVQIPTIAFYFYILIF